MADEIPKPTQQQAVEYLVRLGKALHSYAFPRSPLGLARNLLPHEASRLKDEIAFCEKVVSTAACDPNHRNLRSVLDVRRDLIPDPLDIRLVAYVAWHSLTSEPIGTSVAVLSIAVGMGSVEDMIQARHAIRYMLVSRTGVLVLKDQTALLPGDKLIRLLSGDNRLPIIFTEETLKNEAEAGQRMKDSDIQKKCSPPTASPVPSAQRSPANATSVGNLDSPKAIFNSLRQSVLGMDDTDTLRRFSIAMSLHLRRASQFRQGHIPPGGNQTLLVAGPSGVGKTFMIEEFCKMANIIYTIGNLAECTSSGYAGIDLADILAGLFRTRPKREEVEAGGIVCFDEADKRKSNNRNGDFDATGSGVQAEMLRVIEGTDIQIGGRRTSDGGRFMLSTRGLAFCLVGCFEQVTLAMNSQAKAKQPLGFGSRVESVGHAPDIREALTTYFMPELCNRIVTVLYIRPPSLEALFQIVTAPNGILAKQNQTLQASGGLTLKPDEQAVKEICAYAHSSKTFARGTRSLLQKLSEDALFEEWRGELVIGAGEVRKAIDGLRQGVAGLK